MRVADSPTVSEPNRHDLGFPFVRSTNWLQSSALHSTAPTPSKANTSYYEVGLKSRNGLVFTLLSEVLTADAPRPHAAASSLRHSRNSSPLPEHTFSAPRSKQAVTGLYSLPDQSTRHRHTIFIIHLNIIFLCTSRSHKRCAVQSFPTRILHDRPTSSMSAICLAHPILADLVTPIIYG
jgi:hypothetical protein